MAYAEADVYEEINPDAAQFRGRDGPVYELTTGGRERQKVYDVPGDFDDDPAYDRASARRDVAPEPGRGGGRLVPKQSKAKQSIVVTGQPIYDQANFRDEHIYEHSTRLGDDLPDSQARRMRRTTVDEYMDVLGPQKKSKSKRGRAKGHNVDDELVVDAEDTYLDLREPAYDVAARVPDHQYDVARTKEATYERLPDSDSMHNIEPDYDNVPSIDFPLAGVVRDKGGTLRRGNAEPLYDQIVTGADGQPIYDNKDTYLELGNAAARTNTYDNPEQYLSLGNNDGHYAAVGARPGYDNPETYLSVMGASGSGKRAYADPRAMAYDNPETYLSVGELEERKGDATYMDIKGSVRRKGGNPDEETYLDIKGSVKRKDVDPAEETYLDIKGSVKRKDVDPAEETYLDIKRSVPNRSAGETYLDVSTLKRDGKGSTAASTPRSAGDKAAHEPLYDELPGDTDTLIYSNASDAGGASGRRREEPVYSETMARNVRLPFDAAGADMHDDATPWDHGTLKSLPEDACDRNALYSTVDKSLKRRPNPAPIYEQLRDEFKQHMHASDDPAYSVPKKDRPSAPNTTVLADQDPISAALTSDNAEASGDAQASSIGFAAAGTDAVAADLELRDGAGPPAPLPSSAVLLKSSTLHDTYFAPARGSAAAAAEPGGAVYAAPTRAPASEYQHAEAVHEYARVMVDGDMAGIHPPERRSTLTAAHQPQQDTSLPGFSGGSDGDDAESGRRGTVKGSYPREGDGEADAAGKRKLVMGQGRIPTEQHSKESVSLRHVDPNARASDFAVDPDWATRGDLRSVPRDQSDGHSSDSDGAASPDKHAHSPAQPRASLPAEVDRSLTLATGSRPAPRTSVAESQLEAAQRRLKMGVGQLPDPTPLQPDRKPLRHVEDTGRLSNPSDPHHMYGGIVKPTSAGQRSSPTEGSSLNPPVQLRTTSLRGSALSDGGDVDGAGRLTGGAKLRPPVAPKPGLFSAADDKRKGSGVRGPADDDDALARRRLLPMGQGELPDDASTREQVRLRHVGSDEEEYTDSDDFEFDDDIVDYSLHSGERRASQPAEHADGDGSAGDAAAGATRSARTKHRRGVPRTQEEMEARRGRHFVVGKGELPPEEQRVDWRAEFEARKQRLRKVARNETAGGAHVSAPEAGSSQAPEWLTAMAARKKSAAIATLAQQESKPEDKHIYDEYNPRAQGSVQCGGGLMC